MTSTDIRDVVNHISMWGCDAVVKRLGRKWTVQFRGFGYPGTFATKTAAQRWAGDWALALSQREAA